MKTLLASSQARFWARTVAVAVFAYLVGALAQGGEFVDLGSFLWGLGGAVANAILGLLTPLEPYTGKQYAVSVPSIAKEDPAA